MSAGSLHFMASLAERMARPTAQTKMSESDSRKLGQGYTNDATAT